MLKLHQLRDFVAVAEARTIRGGARAVGLAQPAVTRSVRELEATVGQPLLQRHARGVVLTPAGERFLVRARAALAELNRGVDEARQIGGEPGGSVSVALSSAAMFGLLPRANAAFRRQCPQVHLHLHEATFPSVEPLLREGRIDFYVGPRPERPPGRDFAVQTLFPNQRLVLARRGHPLARTRRLAQLQGAQWLYHGLRERAEQDLDDLFGSHGLTPPQALTRADSLMGIVVLLLESDALSLLPRQWIAWSPLAALLQALPLAEVLPAPDIVLVARAGLPLTPAAEALAVQIQRAVPRSAGRQAPSSRKSGN